MPEPMLPLDQRKCTEPAVAHIRPLLLKTLSLQAGPARSYCTVFLYQHLNGSWAVGTIRGYLGLGAGDGVVVAERMPAARGSQEEAVQRYGSHARDTYQELERMGFSVKERVLPEPLTVAQEVALSDAWLLPADRRALWAAARLGMVSRDIPGLYRRSRELQSNRIQTLRNALSRDPAMEYLRPLAHWLAPFVPQDARVWAFFLLQAAESAQDGIEDTLQVLERRGAEAFCALLPDTTMEYLSEVWDTEAQIAPEGPVPRYTVADLVDQEMCLSSTQVLDAWCTAPFVSPANSGWQSLPIPPLAGLAH